MNRHCSSTVEPGARLVAAIAPGLTIGLVRPSPLRSIASSELNGRPVALTPTRRRAASGPRTSQTSANTNGFDTLMIENRMIGVAARVSRAVDPDHAEAEEIGVNVGQRRIDVGVRAVAVRRGSAHALATPALLTTSGDGRRPVET